MIDIKEEIISHLEKNRDEYKRILRPVQLRRNKLYEQDSIEEWQEIADSYETAIVVTLYDDLSQRLDLPIDELYIMLHDLRKELSQFFEPDN